MALMTELSAIRFAARGDTWLFEVHSHALDFEQIVN
jgi:hypothetical protein